MSSEPVGKFLGMLRLISNKSKSLDEQEVLSGPLATHDAQSQSSNFGPCFYMK